MSISGPRAFSHHPTNHKWGSKPHTRGTGSAFYPLGSDLLPALIAADISWASCTQVINQGWICHGRRGARYPLQISSFCQSGAEAILMWLHNYYVHAGVESRTLCHNPGTKSCFFSHVFCSSVLASNFTVAVMVAPCCLDTSIHCHPVLLSVAPLSGITMGFREQKKKQKNQTQTTEDSGWENLLLEIPSWHSLLISFCSLRNLESCPEKLVLDSAGFHSWLSVK